MNNVIIRAKDLSKVYRLYSKPHYRFLDMFGFLKNRPGAYTEHAALDRINLEIKQGEKIAIIGRNGAGKSTFLKLVTDVIQPTSGQLEVKGKVHALLEIGTGFHPDFTGRENVYAYLAQLGITGREADQRCAEIIEFAELEEYMDQPMKTYSTGMGVRLMFSTSTSITPNVLVLDEVLGVGDAYFTQKSFERIHRLCEGEGTTLLLVTHDIYTAIKIASRVIWIDRGRILMDGDGPTVVKAYEDSIRAQEEHRLRKRKQARLQSLRQNGTDKAPDHLLVEIHSGQNKPQACPVYFSRIELYQEGTPVDRLPLGPEAFENEAESHLYQEGTSWGDTIYWEGHLARPLLNYGSAFHKLAGVFVVPDLLTKINRASTELVVEYWSEVPCDLTVQVFIDKQGFDLGSLPPTQGQWAKHVIPIQPQKDTAPIAEPEPEINTTGIQGTGAIIIEQVAVRDKDDSETYFLKHGEPVTFLLDYRVVDPSLCEKAQVALTFHKEGVQTACRIITRDLLFDASKKARGRIRLYVPKIILGNGIYSISVMIAEEGYYDKEQTVFYSINPGVYFVLSRLVEITVSSSGLIGEGVVFVGEGHWFLEDTTEGTPKTNLKTPSNITN